MKQSYTGWVATFLVLLFPILGLAGWEALQRHRFSVQAERLDAALQAFQSGASMIGQDGRPMPTASGRTSAPYFVLNTQSIDQWDFRLQLVSLGAVFVDAQGRWNPVWMNVQIEQKRSILWRSPKTVVSYHGIDAPLEASFFNAIKDFTHLSGVQPR